MAEDQDKVTPDENIKVTLIGGSGVGKTCIIRRYYDNEYVENPASTCGGSYSAKQLKINNKIVQIDLWDTAGQERFRSLGKHFYKDAYIVILVYDITNRKSFDELKEVWYPSLKEFGEKYSVLGVVGNKCDLYENEEVKEAEAREYSQQIGATYMLVSAKSGDNINLLFDTLIKQYLGPAFAEQLKEIKKEKGETGKLTKKDAKKKNKKKGGLC
jgi:small GTP-binding protein